MDLVSSPGRPGFFAFGQEAVGVIAIGQSACGVIALGQLSRGVVAVGQLAVGVVAVGQLAVGALFATGMVGLAGSHGFGLVLHTLPRVFREKNPEVPAPSPTPRLLAGDLSYGHVAARIDDDGVTLDEAEIPVEVHEVRGHVNAARKKGYDRAVIEVAVQSEPDAAGGYRESVVKRRFVAKKVFPYWSAPPSHIAYARPLGGAGKRPSVLEIVLRSLAALVTFAIVTGVTIVPVIEALFLEP